MIVAFFDVDGTLTKTNIWRHMLAYFRAHKTRRITNWIFSGVHYPIYFLRKLGFINESIFRSIWADHLAWYIRGYSEEKADAVWDWVLEDMIASHVWRDDVVSILKSHLEEQNVVVLVSSGPQPLIRKIGLFLGTQHALGTSLEYKNGKFTGRSLKPICIDLYKADLVKKYLLQEGIEVDFQGSFSYADSVTDLSLLELAGNRIAVYPDEELKSVALQQGWLVISST